jgi:transcriptional regulator with XRE-family HTH domain
MDREQLADFLRRSRERIRPEDVGLAPGSRRRTPGLRREEVAQLAGMSTDYYMRLEQGRSPQPSTQLLASLTRALRLTEDERDHLFLLAGHRPPAGRRAGSHVRPGLLHLLDRLQDTPAQIINDLGDLLAQNELAEALFGCVCTVREQDRNIVWRWFTELSQREAYPSEDHDRYSRLHVADLRAAAAKRPGDDDVENLVKRLNQASPEFAELWALHEVAVRRTSRMRVLHPLIGHIELECETLLAPTEDQRLLIFTAAPGTDYANDLGLLQAIGHEQFPGASSGPRRG